MANEKSRVKTLTRRDIAKKIAELKNLKPEDTLEWVESVFIAVRELLKTADPEIRIEIRTFGIFEVKMTKEKPQARNPRTGEIVVVPARRKTHFKPSKFLKEFLQVPMSEENRQHNTAMISATENMQENKVNI
jgi:integration host factor subunit beta